MTAWTNWTPTFTATTGTIIPETVDARYKIIDGDTCLIHCAFTFNDPWDPSVSGFVMMTLPIVSTWGATFHGMKYNYPKSAVMGVVEIGQSAMKIMTTSGAFPVPGPHKELLLCGFYEIEPV